MKHNICALKLILLFLTQSYGLTRAAIFDRESERDETIDTIYGRVAPFEIPKKNYVDNKSQLLITLKHSARQEQYVLPTARHVIIQQYIHNKV